MECDDDSIFSGNSPHMAGAIFMCNKTTKKECFRRKLFGLPSSHAEFVKNVKSGMLLFLFEYEERKLYGVFEAASDGVMNSVNRAFSKSGSSFPAQVHFNSLWACHPLSEYEFQGAIQANYYTHNKFNFDLSYEQVSRLVELFSSKKLSAQIRQDIGFCSEENNRSGNNNVTGRAKSMMFDGSGSDRENDMHRKPSFDLNYSTYSRNPCNRSGNNNVTGQARSMMFGGSESDRENDMHRKPSFDPNCSTYNRNPGPTAGLHNDGTQHLSYPRLRVPSGLQPHLPNITCLAPQADYSPEASYSVNTEGRPFHPIIPGSEGQQQFGVLGLGKLNLDQKFTEAQAHHFRSDLYPSETLTLPYTNHCKPNSFTESNIGSPSLSRRLTEIQIPQFRSPSYTSHEDPRTYSLPSANNHIFGSSSIHDELCLRKEDHVNVSNYVNRYSPLSKFHATDAAGSLGPLRGQINTHGHGYTEASPNVGNVRELRYWNSVPSDLDAPLPLTKNEYLTENAEASFVSRRYSEGCHYRNEYGLARDDNCLECNPVPADHEVQPEKLQRRSVFSRLKAPKIGPAEKICTTKRNSALDLLRHPAYKENQWNKIGRVSKRSLAGSKDDGRKEMENGDEVEPTAVDSLAELESDSETFAKENVEIPFLNFKRRNKPRDLGSENERTISIEGGEGTCKRRKLIRPSFTKDDSSAPIKRVSQEFQNSCQEPTAINSAVINARTNKDEDTRALEAGLVKEEHMNSKFCADDSSAPRKRVSQEFQISCQELQISCQELTAVNSAVINAQTNEDEGSRALEAGLVKGEHPNSKVSAPSGSGKWCAGFGEVLARLPIGTSEERILNSASTADANAAIVFVECGIGYSKESDKKLRTGEDEGSVTNEIGEKSKISGSNCEHIVVEADHRYERTNSLLLQEEDAMLSGINSKEIHLSDANFPDPDSATMEGCHKLKSDTKCGMANSSQLSKRIRVNSAGNNAKDLLQKENIQKKRKKLDP